MWKIGNVEIKNQIVLAPMAGISNSAFRRIAKEMGVGLVVAEMVSDKAIYFGSKKTIDMLYMKEEERPISQQIFGSDKDSFVYAAKYILKTMKPDIIDINMGCPVPKVATRAQAGSALLKNPNKVYEIVKAVVEAVDVPVTVKIRSGWDEKSINAVEIAKVVEKAGASAITVHPRTRAQGYSGKANWNIIKQVKENVKIPVIGNGDIKTAGQQLGDGFGKGEQLHHFLIQSDSRAVSSVAVERRDLAVRIGAGEELVQPLHLLPGGLEGLLTAAAVYADGHQGVHREELGLSGFWIGCGRGAAGQNHQAAQKKKKTLHGKLHSAKSKPVERRQNCRHISDADFILA